MTLYCITCMTTGDGSEVSLHYKETHFEEATLPDDCGHCLRIK